LKHERKGIIFITFCATLFSFLLARGFVYATHQGVHLIVSGYTIHHFVYGIVLVSIAGGAALIFKGYEDKLAVIYGLGLGLIFDEMGFIISGGNYWNRLSYDLIIIFSLVIINVLFFEEFWKKFRKKLKSYRKVHR